MLKKKSINIWLCALLLLLHAAGCADLADGDLSAGQGRLSVGGMELRVEVDNLPATRAVAGTYPAPEASALTYTLTNQDTQESTQLTYDELLASPVLAVGSYTLTATYGAAQMGTTPYLYREFPFVIQPLTTTALGNISIPLACAMIRPEVDDLLPHFQAGYTLTLTDNTAGSSLTVSNQTDYYVPMGHDYTLTLSGTNQLGEAKNLTNSITGAAAATRYLLQCTADLPAFTLPEQPDYNAWSYHIDFTPMTAANISYAAGLSTDRILNNMTYEVSADGGASWQSFTGTKLSGLNPNSTYKFRARFGAVYSTNQPSLTTEGAEPVPNGNMDTWSSTDYKTYGKKTIYEYYCGSSSTDKSWSSGNVLTMNGVSGGTSTGISNQRVAYRWNSCTIPTSDTYSGSGSAAEIRTMALANFNINRGTGMFAARDDMAQKVLANCNIFIGYLYLGTTDMQIANVIPNKYEIIHPSRPKLINFYYKYAPYNNDSFTVKAELYSVDKEMIASATLTAGMTQDSYVLQSLNFNYTNHTKKANYLFIQFQSGSQTTTNDVTHIKSSSYELNPWSLDTFVGSVLKIDDITLIYD